MKKSKQDMRAVMASIRARKGKSGKVLKTTSTHPSCARVKSQTKSY